MLGTTRLFHFSRFSMLFPPYSSICWSRFSVSLTSFTTLLILNALSGSGRYLVPSLSLVLSNGVLFYLFPLTLFNSHVLWLALVCVCWGPSSNAFGLFCAYVLFFALSSVGSTISAFFSPSVVFCEVSSGSCSISFAPLFSFSCYSPRCAFIEGIRHKLNPLHRKEEWKCERE